MGKQLRFFEILLPDKFSYLSNLPKDATIVIGQFWGHFYN